MELTERKKRFLVYGGLWIIFFIVLFVVAIIVPGIILDISAWIANIQIPKLVYKIIKVLGIIIFWGTVIKGIIDSWSQVPQEHVWLVEMFGENVATWEAGLHLPFPYFNLITVQEVYMGEQQMELYMQENTPEKYGYGDVEFKDISASVKAIIFFRIFDPAKAVYRINNLLEALEEKMDSVIRSFLGQYAIDEANVLRARASLPEILEGDYLYPESHAHLSPEEQDNKLAEAPIYQEIFNNWGTELTGLAISDIILTEKQKELRLKILEAQKKAEAAEYKKKEQIILASGDKISYALEGDGLGYQIERLMKTGLEADKSAAYLIGRKKWENVGEKGATVIDSGGNTGFSGFGARFAAGQEAFNKNQKSGNNEDKNVSEPEGGEK